MAIEKDYYSLHTMDVNATTDPNDKFPVWLDIYYFGNEIEFNDMKELNIELSVGDAMRMIHLLEAGINLVQAGRDYTMYN